MKQGKNMGGLQRIGAKRLDFLIKQPILRTQFEKMLLSEILTQNNQGDCTSRKNFFIETFLIPQKPSAFEKSLHLRIKYGRSLNQTVQHNYQNTVNNLVDAELIKQIEITHRDRYYIMDLTQPPFNLDKALILTKNFYLRALYVAHFCQKSPAFFIPGNYLMGRFSKAQYKAIESLNTHKNTLDAVRKIAINNIFSNFENTYKFFKEIENVGSDPLVIKAFTELIIAKKLSFSEFEIIPFEKLGFPSNQQQRKEFIRYVIGINRWFGFDSKYNKKMDKLLEKNFP